MVRLRETPFFPGFRAHRGVDAGWPGCLRHAARQRAGARRQVDVFTELPKAKVKTGGEPIEPPPPAQPENREYVLQAAQFLRHHDARVLQGALMLDGMSASISSRPRARGGSWHRVLVGPYETEGDAQNALTQLRAKDIRAQILARPAAAINEAEGGGVSRVATPSVRGWRG